MVLVGINFPHLRGWCHLYLWPKHSKVKTLLTHYWVTPDSVSVNRVWNTWRWKISSPCGLLQKLNLSDVKRTWFFSHLTEKNSDCSDLKYSPFISAPRPLSFIFLPFQWHLLFSLFSCTVPVGCSISRQDWGVKVQLDKQLWPLWVFPHKTKFPQLSQHSQGVKNMARK